MMQKRIPSAQLETEMKMAWLKPLWEASARQNYLDRLLAKYCNDHDLTQIEIEELTHREHEKDANNMKKWRAETVNVKLLRGKEDTKYTMISKCEGDYTCEIPGCQGHTNLLVSSLESPWFLFLCLKHYEEFRVYAGSHAPETL